jgi:hypothetical protein
MFILPLFDEQRRGIAPALKLQWLLQRAGLFSRFVERMPHAAAFIKLPV